MMLNIFRKIALIEGLTTITLFLVAMPLKYLAGNDALIFPVGMTHGIAWVAYLLGMLVCLPGKGLSIWQWLRTFIAALFPFGTFLNDPMLARKQAQREAAKT